MSSERESDVFDELSVLIRPNRISLAHEHANELQTLLDEFEGTPEEVVELSQLVVQDLDSTCGHLNQPIVVDGRVIIGRYRFEDIDFKKKSISSIRVGEKLVERVEARSAGYCVVREPNDDGSPRYIICHVAQTPAELVARDLRAGVVYADNYLYIPIDGSAAVQEKTPDLRGFHLPALEYYLPELLQDVDVAVLNGNTPTEILQTLSQVDLSQLPPAIIDDEVQRDLFNYVDHIAGISKYVPYQIGNIEEFLVERDEGYIHLSVGKGFRIPGDVEGFCFYPDQENTTRFALVMHLPAENDRTERAFIPLSDQIELIKFPTLNITR